MIYVCRTYEINVDLPQVGSIKDNIGIPCILILSSDICLI